MSSVGGRDGSQGDGLGEPVVGEARLEVGDGNEVDGRLEQRFELGLTTGQGEETDAGGDVDEQVDVAAGSLVPSGEQAVGLFSGRR